MQCPENEIQLNPGALQAKKDQLSGAKADAEKARFEQEVKVNAERAEALAAKKAELAAEVEAAAKTAAGEETEGEAAEGATEEPQAE